MANPNKVTPTDLLSIAARSTIEIQYKVITDTGMVIVELVDRHTGEYWTIGLPLDSAIIRDSGRFNWLKTKKEVD